MAFANQLRKFLRLALVAACGSALSPIPPMIHQAHARIQIHQEPGVMLVENNAELLTSSTGAYPGGVWRNGFTAKGDVEPIFYKPSGSACTLNGGNGDNGSQVKSSDGKCWLAKFHHDKPNVKQFGAKGDGTSDDGPAFRAACAWALENSSNPIYVPSGTYRFNTLDDAGGAALYLNTGLADGKACSLEGPRSAFDYASAGPLDGPAMLILGDGLNRPLLRHRAMGASSHIANLTLHGNGAEQTGWVGGPAIDRLFVAQEDDADVGSSFPETGIIFDDVVIEGGYNGNLYVGNYRYFWGTRLWSQYSGQTTADYSVWVRGYDSTLWLPAIGNNVGGGIIFESGAQYQVVAGAIWTNGGCGMSVGGLQVNYANIWGTNFHDNERGFCNLNNEPFNGTTEVGAVTLTGATFDQNNTSDVYVVPGAQVNRQMKLVAPHFLGNSLGGAKPTYNLEGAGGIVEISMPTFGTHGSFTTAFATDPALVFCTGGACPSTAFVPTLGNGTPTYVSQMGYATRQGNHVHAVYSVTTTDLGGATGSMTVGNLPWSAATLSNYVDACHLGSVSGWTAPANYDWLTSSIGTSEQAVILRRNSKSGQASDAADASEFAAASTVSGSCDYIGEN